MSLLTALLGMGAIAAQPFAMSPMQSLMKPTRKALATHPTGQHHIIRTAPGSRMGSGFAQVPIHRTEFRDLERNKYAPWGRGVHSGLA